MSEAIAIVIGAAISGLIGVLVVMTQQSLIRRHHLENARAVRLSEFSAAGWAASLALGRLARAPVEEKAQIEDRERLSELVDRFNSCMAQIQLLESGELYRAAHRLDRSLAELVAAAREAQYSTADWRLRRASTSEAVDEFQRAARKILGTGDAGQDVSI